MFKDPLLIVQIVSIIGYVGTVFFLYRVLVKQKDATIDLLKNRILMLEQQLSTGREYDQQKISLLEKQLTLAKEQDPDILLKKYKERLDLTIEELKKMEMDTSTHKDALTSKEKELEIIAQELEIAKLKAELESKKADATLEIIREMIEHGMRKITFPEINISQIKTFPIEDTYHIGPTTHPKDNINPNIQDTIENQQNDPINH